MTTYSFGGSALSSFGRVTVVNDYLDTGARRGENITIPFQHGATFVQKYYGERKITLGLAISVASATVLESTLDNLKKLCAYRTQQTLSLTMEDTTVRTVSAVVDSPFEIDRKTDSFVKAVIEFKLAKPYFNSSVQTNGTATMSAGTVALNVVNTGTFEEVAPVITYVGPLNNPVITNSLNGYVLTYSGTIPAGAGGTVILQQSNGEYIASNDLGTNKISSFTHSGGAEYMRFNAGGTTNGTNAMSIVNTGGTTGKIIFSFYPPYL